MLRGITARGKKSLEALINSPDYQFPKEAERDSRGLDKLAEEQSQWASGLRAIRVCTWTGMDSDSRRPDAAGDKPALLTRS
jgi:hypothetical protein